MRRTYTIKIKDSTGTETVEVFKSKKSAKAYCTKFGALKGRFEVEITVEGGGARQSERFIRENV
jgi:hypothetical protein